MTVRVDALFVYPVKVGIRLRTRRSLAGVGICS
jgi:hypothetical protein